jgi:hypothetical protein
MEGRSFGGGRTPRGQQLDHVVYLMVGVSEAEPVMRVRSSVETRQRGSNIDASILYTSWVLDASRYSRFQKKLPS